MHEQTRSHTNVCVWHPVNLLVATIPLERAFNAAELGNEKPEERLRSCFIPEDHLIGHRSCHRYTQDATMEE